MKAGMSDKEKGNTITQIMVSMKQAALAEYKPFDDGIFFDLAFMSDEELLRISKLCGIK